MITHPAAEGAPTGATPDPGAGTLVLTVPGVTCEHCRASITNEVGGVAGVASVVVDLDDKLVTVTGSRLDRDLIVAAIDEAGFDVA